MKRDEIEKISKNVLDLEDKLEGIGAKMTGEIKKNEMAANAEDEFQKEFKARLAKLPKNEPNQAFFQEFLQPKVDSLNEETYEWLNKNRYHDILTTQIR